MQQSVETQPIGIEGIGLQFAGQLAELLLDLLRHVYIEDAFYLAPKSE